MCRVKLPRLVRPLGVSGMVLKRDPHSGLHRTWWKFDLRVAARKAMQRILSWTMLDPTPHHGQEVQGKTKTAAALHCFASSLKHGLPSAACTLWPVVQLNPKFEKYVKDGVKFVGNKHAPKWLITAGWKKKSDGSPDLKNGKKQMTVIGEVHCPCHDAGVHGTTPFPKCALFTCDDFPCVCAHAHASACSRACVRVCVCCVFVKICMKRNVKVAEE